MGKVTFGNRKAGVFCNMAAADRLDLIVEGLPIILSSAQGFWRASRELGGPSREARVLEGFAQEEAAKILILVDLVRCPAKRVARTCGAIVRTYYDHLGRLLYGAAQTWKPTNVAELRRYVDHSRRGHDLEGWAEEHILPNWSRYARESAMYADIEVHEDSRPHWNEPQMFGQLEWDIAPTALRLGEAMAAIGLVGRAGLEAMADIWNATDFVEREDWSDNDRLVQRLFERLDAERLVTEAATAEHVGLLREHWQMPMYDLDFRELPVDEEELMAERERLMWSDII